jgi:hypothetical protein
MSELLNKIHSTGYWRVNIKPTIFKDDVIPSLTAAHEVIEQCGVLLRGWDYPHFTNAEIINGEDYIEGSADFESHLEYWRLYQSGQFIHHFACREDYEVDPNDLSPLSVPTPSPSGRYLSILSTLYTITEIFEFSSRLASKDILLSNISISIKLIGMQERQLFFWDRSRYLSLPKISGVPEINFEKIFTKEEIISQSAELAMKATIFIFERFNWPHHSDVFFPEEQKKLLERRL